MYISGSSVSCWILLISRLQRRIKRDTQVLSTKINFDGWVLASSTSISHHIPLNQIIPGDGADFEKEARAAEMRARPHYQAGRKDSHALKLYRYAARPHVQVDTDKAWSRIKFSQYESRLALWKLTLKFQPRRSIWNGLLGPIRTTFGRSLRLAEFFWFDLHTMCIQCAYNVHCQFSAGVRPRSWTWEPARSRVPNASSSRRLLEIMCKKYQKVNDVMDFDGLHELCGHMGRFQCSTIQYNTCLQHCNRQ